MRKKLLFVFMLLAAMAILMATAVVVSSERIDRDVIGYNVLQERMFKGVVESNPDAVEGLMVFSLKTASGTVEVQTGPKEFVERSGFKFRAGDRVTVIGMPAFVNKRNVVLAREVRGPNGALVIRNEMGVPLWEKDPTLMDPERRTGSHELCELS